MIATTTEHRLIRGDCLDVLPRLGSFDMAFIDPPDGIGYAYKEYDDNREAGEYLAWLERVLGAVAEAAPVVWLSFNARWTVELGQIAGRIIPKGFEVRPCVQTYTFGQQSRYDLKSCHRPLWRFMRPGTPLYPEQARVPSWRMLNGDKRADPRGCVPGDVFDFPRVTGNSKQRRAWHGTQLNEGLVSRCVLHSTRPGATVLDAFGGTGTTMRACKAVGRSSVLVELDSTYCAKIAEEHGIEVETLSGER